MTSLMIWRQNALNVYQGKIEIDQTDFSNDEFKKRDLIDSNIFCPDRVNFQIGQGWLLLDCDQWEAQLSQPLANHKPDRVTFQASKLVLTE